MIEVLGLTKCYGTNIAVDNLTFTVEKGSICGFLGPNGAGKSTTMNMLTGFLSSTDGTVKIDGFDIYDEPLAAKRKIGYLPEQPPVYPDMTPYEYLDFIAQLRGFAIKDRKNLIEKAMETTEITSMQSRLIRNLSKGYCQRVGLAGALLGEPEVLILDEPTVGLDPMQIAQMRTLIAGLAERHTILLSSHILSEISAICDKVIIISKGKIVASDTPENLSGLMQVQKSVSVTAQGNEEAIISVLKAALPNAAITMEDAGEKGIVKLQVADTSEDLRVVIGKALMENSIVCLGVQEQKISLEDVFIELTAAQENILEIDEEENDKNDSNI